VLHSIPPRELSTINSPISKNLFPKLLIDRIAARSARLFRRRRLGKRG
jgi:hypothetical protein